MGKGLSNLQQFILVKSIENIPRSEGYVKIFKQVYGLDIEGTEIYAPEILYEYYGFPKKSWQSPCDIDKSVKGGHGIRYFSMAEIGEKRYKSARVALSKAFLRLEERGLLVRWYFGKKHMGARLTDEGRAAGISLKEAGITSISLIPNSDI